nr:transmembrane protein [Rhizobium sp. Q54]
MTFLRNNGLSIALLLATLLTLLGMLFSGWHVGQEEALQHGDVPPPLWEYATSGDFLSALFENWESEFLQMAMYVCLTAFLYQKGSAESKDPETPHEEVDEDPALHKDDPEAPWPVRQGPVIRNLYSYSLGIVLALLFVASFILHLVNSAAAASEEAVRHNQPAATVAEHLVSAQFWFESFQNWQSEFLSTLVLVVLSIFLRFRGSPESKPVAASYGKTV